MMDDSSECRTVSSSGAIAGPECLFGSRLGEGQFSARRQAGLEILPSKIWASKEIWRK